MPFRNFTLIQEQYTYGDGTSCTELAPSHGSFFLVVYFLPDLDSLSQPPTTWQRLAVAHRTTVAARRLDAQLSRRDTSTFFFWSCLVSSSWAKNPLPPTCRIEMGIRKGSNAPECTLLWSLCDAWNYRAYCPSVALCCSNTPQEDQSMEARRT